MRQYKDLDHIISVFQKDSFAAPWTGEVVLCWYWLSLGKTLFYDLIQKQVGVS